jgi:hypothetical protein
MQFEFVLPVLFDDVLIDISCFTQVFWRRRFGNAVSV